MHSPVETLSSPLALSYPHQVNIAEVIGQHCPRVAVIGAQPALRELVAGLCQPERGRVQVTQFANLSDFQGRAKGETYTLTILFRHVNELAFHHQLQSGMAARPLYSEGRLLILSELLGERDREYLRQHQVDLLLPIKIEPDRLTPLLAELLRPHPVMPNHWHYWTDRLQPQFQPDLSECSLRELKLLSLLQQGLANKQIAYRMELSESTVKLHMGILFRRWNIKGRMQLALLAKYQYKAILDRLG